MRERGKTTKKFRSKQYLYQLFKYFIFIIWKKWHTVYEEKNKGGYICIKHMLFLLQA